MIIINNKICPNWIIHPFPNYTVTKYPENQFCNVIIFNCAKSRWSWRSTTLWTTWTRGCTRVFFIPSAEIPMAVPFPPRFMWVTLKMLSWYVSLVTLLDQQDHKIGDDSITQLSGLETCTVAQKYHQKWWWGLHCVFNYFQCLHR